MAAKILGIMSGAKIPSHYINIQQQPNQTITVDTSVGIRYTGSDETSHTESYTTNGNFEYVEVISAKTKAAKGYHRGDIVFTPNTITNGSVLESNVTVTATPAVEYTYESLNIPSGYTPLFYKLMENGMIEHVDNAATCMPTRSANIYTDFNCTIPFTPPGDNPEGKYSFFIGKNDDDIDLDLTHFSGGYTLLILGKLNGSNASILDFSDINFNRSNGISTGSGYVYTLNLSSNTVKEFTNLNLDNFVKSFYNGIDFNDINYYYSGGSSYIPYAFTPFTFINCTNLINAPKIPNGTRSTQNMFAGCSNLINAPTIPNSVIYMDTTFSNCTSLINAPEIPNSVISMNYTFADCTNLINAPEIPNSVISINSTFYHCTNLINAPVIPNSVTNMDSTFRNCTSLINAPEIPNSVVSMSYTFADCTNLINAPEIPNSVVYMSYTFANCSNLTNTPNIPNSVTSMNSTFYNCVNLLNANLNIDVKDIPNLYQGAPTGCYPTAVYINGVFVNCVNLKDISLNLTCKDTNNWNRAIINSSYPCIFNGCNNINNFSLYVDHVNITYIYNIIIPISARNINIVDNVSQVIPVQTYSYYYTNPKTVNATIHLDNATSIDNLFRSYSNLKSVNMYCPNIVSMSYTFANCTVLEGNINVHSNNVTNVYGCFMSHNNSYSVNVYAYSNSTTYNTFKTYLGGTDNSVLNVHLKTF